MTVTGESSAANVKMDQDKQYLQLLSIFHYVVGGIMAMFGCFPIIHLAIGIAIVTGAMDQRNPAPPAFGWLFIAVAVVFMTMAWSIAVAIIVPPASWLRIAPICTAW